MIQYKLNIQSQFIIQIQIMGNGDSKITTASLDLERLAPSSKFQRSKYLPPFRRFSLIGKTILNPNNHRYSLTIEQPYQESFQVEVPVYLQLMDAFNQKTQQITIDYLFHDDEFQDRPVFHSLNKTQKQAILIRSYQNQECHTFANILTELHCYLMIKNINNPHIHHLKEHYIINTGIEQIDQPYSHIILLQPVDANLSEIINFRKQTKWEWTEAQFTKLTKDLLEGLSALHSQGFSHNDIRPSTVYFSLQKNCYLLGSLSNCLKNQGNINSNKIKHNSHFNAPQLSHQSEFDLQKGDVYSLGVTLLCAFYLCHPGDRKQFINLSKSYENRHQIRQLIDQMITTAQQRPSIQEINSKLVKTDFQFTNMNGLIQSMRHRNRPNVHEFAKDKFLIGQAYKRLGLWNEWKEKFQEAFQIQQQNYDDYNKAEGLRKLAMIEDCRGEHENSTIYAKKAANIYRRLGAKELDNGNFGLAQNYCQKAVDCSKFYEFDNDSDLATSLQDLSQVHLQKGQYSLSKALLTEASTILAKSSGKQSFEFCRMKIHEAKIQTEFGSFKNAQGILDECQAIINKKQSIKSNQTSKLKADVLTQKAQTLLKQVSYEEGGLKESILAKAQSYGVEALSTYENIDQDNHLKVADIIRILGEIKTKQLKFVNAKADFERSLQLIQHVELNSYKSQQIRQSADIKCRIGFCQSKMLEHDNAIESYSQALKIYKRIYGSDHNRHSAMAIGNLGSVYNNMKQKIKARQCLKCCLSILADVVGTKDSNYLYFKGIQKSLDAQV